MSSSHAQTQDPAASGGHLVLTDYVPELYAFRFPNAFVNKLYTGRIPPFIGRSVSIATRGRCGGMAFASLDFFSHRIPVPTLHPPDFSSAPVPPDGHPLADYIYARQRHSMLTTLAGLRDGLRYIRWSGAATTTILAKTSDQEQAVIESLDRGQPVVLGLIKATSRKLRAQGVNHQVVCYGYHLDITGHRRFYICDPNEPFPHSADATYSLVLERIPHPGGAALSYQVIRPDRVDRWRGFFIMGYRPRRPHPQLLPDTF